MSIFTSFIIRKINESCELKSTHKKVLTTEIKKGNLSPWDVIAASINPNKQKRLAERCEKTVLAAYFEKNSTGTKQEITYMKNSHYGYKPINAGIFWKTVATKQGYVMQEHFSGRRRILTDDGYWVKSGQKDRIERKFQQI